MGKRLSTITKENEPLRQFLSASLNRPPQPDEQEMYGDFGSISEDDLNGLEIRFVDLARELEQAGAGKFMVGRRGHPSRLEWNRDVRQIARDALGAESERLGPGSQQDDSHLVNLPRGRIARLDLPTGLTDQEAEIIIATVRALVTARDGPR